MNVEELWIEQQFYNWGVPEGSGVLVPWTVILTLIYYEGKENLPSGGFSQIN